MTVISKRFKLVFMASLASMTVAYILILTDNIVAGQFVGDEAVAAMTLVEPIMTLVFFLSYMVAGGLVMMYSYAKGRNDRTKANELFSMGVICSVVAGAAVTFILVAFRSEILSVWEISPELMNYAVEYCRGLMFFALPCILNTYFYTIYIAEGEENICMRATIAMFIVNLILDIALGYKIGVIGIGIATTIGNLVGFLFHAPYLFSKNCQLRFIKYWKGKEFWQGIFYSWYHSMDMLFLSLLPIIFAQFVIIQFGERELVVVTVVINMLTLLIAIYTGIVDCLQPMVCQYHAEGALHSVRKTMHLGISSTIAVTLALIAFSFVFAAFLPDLFGVSPEEQLHSDCVWAVRIFMPFTIFLGVTLMFSNYYIYIERLNLGAAIKFLLLLALPSAGMFAGNFGLQFMWAGVGLSFIVALAINLLLTRPNVLLMDAKQYARQFSFDTVTAQEKLPELRISLEKYLARTKLEPRNFLMTLTEEIFMIYARRASKFELEVTIIPADRLILIFRDNGTPESPSSPLLDKIANKSYMISGDENKLVVII